MMEFDEIEDLAQLRWHPRCWFQASTPRQLPCRPCADTVHALHTRFDSAVERQPTIMDVMVCR